MFDKSKEQEDFLYEFFVSERVGESPRSEGSVFQCIPHEATHFFDRKGFLNNSPSTEEFGDIQEILVAGAACHGDNFSVKEFLCQRERDLHAVSFRHQNICNHKIGGVFSIERETDLPILRFANRMAVIFQNAA